MKFEEEKSASDILEKKEQVVFKGKHLQIKKRTFAKQKTPETEDDSTKVSPQHKNQNTKKAKKRLSSETTTSTFLAKDVIDKMKQLTSVIIPLYYFYSYKITYASI